MAPGAIRTLYATGFPPDVRPRELRNLFRFASGFEEASVVNNTQIFARFTSERDARQALDLYNGVTFDDIDFPEYRIKAEMARRDMEPQEERDGRAQDDRGDARDDVRGTRARRDSRARRAPRERRHRSPARGEQSRGGGYSSSSSATAHLDTVAVVGLTAKGLDVHDVGRWFEKRPGFITSQVSSRVDALFIKFGSHRDADDAILDAESSGIKAEFARRNLEADDRSAGAPAEVEHMPPAKRSRHDRDELRTIVVFGIREKGLSRSQLEGFFADCNGYETHQYSDRIDAIFIAFVSGSAAEKAMRRANDRSMEAEWARRNLEGSRESYSGGSGRDSAPFRGGHEANGGRDSAHRRQDGDGDKDTIVILGVLAKGCQYQDVEEWLAGRWGFLKCQVNEKIDAVFAKFASSSSAEKAIDASHKTRAPAEWARRNLD
eukprot:TRINITY_DN33148_c0_g1_i1.p1 TRINITY_DN33148_c0_g1~~TRINITY_DN33148_c0_g1_i1.p1  ORF type:complete len:435 (-),score=66.15 TRINITY_DN33148_c0_g1_i1:35-1339(-)